MAIIPRDADKFVTYLYSVEARFLPDGGSEDDTIDLTDRLTHLHIVKDFDGGIYPYVRLEATLSQQQVKVIQDGYAKASVFITLDKWEAQAGAPAKRSQKRVWDSAEFVIANLDRTPVPASPASPSAVMGQTISFPIELLPRVAMEINKGINNRVFHEATAQEAVASLLSARKPKSVPYRFFLAPSDSEREYETMLVPPLPLNQAVAFVDDKYGLYGGRLTFFMDVDTGYVLSTTKIVYDPELDPFSEVHVELLSPKDMLPGSVSGVAWDEDAGAIRLRTVYDPPVSQPGPAADELAGDQVKLVSASFDEASGSSCKSINPAGELRDGVPPKERVRWQAYDNRLIPDKMRNARRESQAVVSVQLEGTDVSALTPAADFRLLTTTPEREGFEGAWRLVSSHVVLQKPQSARGLCECHAQCRFRPATSG